MSIYVVDYRYTDDVALRDAERATHRDYLRDLADEGRLLVAGPWGDGEAPGAHLVLRAASVPEVEGLVAGDPFVKVGVVAEYEIHLWDPILGPVAEHLAG